MLVVPEGDPVAHTNPAAYSALNDGKQIVSWNARTDPPPAALSGCGNFRPGAEQATAPLARVGTA